jgi:S1-C subfamily serine protease
MRCLSGVLPGLCLLLSVMVPVNAEAVEMVRSLSGPSGKVNGAEFIIEEIRNRFVYPQDSSLTVYFEFKAPKGEYVLTAYLKDPQERVISIAPNLNIRTVDDNLNAYWIFMLDETQESGIWTVEVRVNGKPSGSHFLDLVVPEAYRAKAEQSPQMPSMNELYSSLSKSLVWIYKRVGEGERVEMYSGFIIDQDTVMTAFQAIDSVVDIVIEFAGGKKISTDEVIAFDRFKDWALLKIDTGDAPHIPFGEVESIVIGEQLIVFSSGQGASRIIGTVNISGRTELSGFGERVFTDPRLPPVAIGGPLLDFYGQVVGIIGGSLVQGAPRSKGYRVDQTTFVDSSAFVGDINIVTVVPVDQKVLRSDHRVMSLRELRENGTLTPALTDSPVTVFATTTREVSRDYVVAANTRFSRKENIVIFTNWQNRKGIRKGTAAINIYDAINRLRAKPIVQELNIPVSGVYQFAAEFSAATLETGWYRVDVSWDDLPVERLFFYVTD